MRRHFLVWVALIFAAQMSWAVDPSVALTTYYAGIDGKAADANDNLRKQLCTIISNGYTTIGYSSLQENVYAASTDPSDFYVGSNMAMEDIYSSKAYVSGDAKSSATSCGTGWNKEHTVPQSWFGEASPMKSDAHHVFPTDIKMNSVRSSYPYGETDASKACDSYGYGRLGTSTFPGYTGTVFDPGEKDERGRCYRGDLARVYFYMVTRYRTMNFTSGTGSTSFTYSGGVADLTDYMKNLMLKWHREDPVSEKELIRNNAIYAHQKNRNPFVDYPCLVEYIWGEHKGESVELSALISGYSGEGTDCCSGGSSIDPIPADYYTPVQGFKDSVLKSELAKLTWTKYTDVYSYGSGSHHTWDAFWYTDRNEADNSVIDMYSNNKRYFNPDSTTASVADCDIEHMFPNSWFGAKAGNRHAYSDLHHLVPADYSANRSKSNYGPGIPTDTTFNNGVWVNGKDANRDNLTVFCPPDEYKGDFARAYFYIATTYGDTATWQTDNAIPYMTNDDWHEFLPEMRDLLLTWHRNDPVSEKELIRNNTVARLQGNRNPFIDYPCLAEYIWGTMQGEAFNLNCSSTPTPKYTITWSVKGKKTTDEVIEGIQPTAPSVEDCSDDRVFMGWTTSSTVSSEKPEVLYPSNEIPNATAAATYYAVFADKETTGSGSKTVIERMSNTQPYVSLSGWTASGGVYTTAASSGESAPSFKMSADGNYIQSAVMEGAITAVSYWYKPQNATGTLKFYVSTDGKTFTELTAEAVEFSDAGTAGTKNITLDVNDNYRAIKIVYTKTTSNVALDDISITYGSSSTTYSNYGLLCEEIPDVTVTFHRNNGSDETKTQVMPQAISTPLEANTWYQDHFTFLGWALTYYGDVTYTDEASITTDTDIDLYAVWLEDPKYTSTFINDGKVYDAVEDYPGTSILIYDPTPCEPFEFVGWSFSEYPAGNTESPSLSVPEVIGMEDQIYYAVYTYTTIIPGTPGEAVEDTLWYEDFSGFKANDVPSAETPGKPQVYGGGNVTYACTNGGGNTKVFTSQISAGGESPELLIAKTDGTFTVTGIPTGKADSLTLSFKTNKAKNISVTILTDGISIFSSSTDTEKRMATYVFENPNAVETFDLTFTNTNVKENARVDNFLLTFLTEGGVPDQKVTCYTTAPGCSSEPGPATDIQDPVLIPKARKVLINGQLFILREGKIYTLQGLQIR